MSVDSGAPRVLVDTIVPRTLPLLVDRAVAAAAPGDRAELWVFEDAEARRDGEARLRAAGLDGRIRSAYKPLVHAVLEEIDEPGIARIEVRYPRPGYAAPDRFRAEAYPIGGLVGGAEVTFEPAGRGLDHRILIQRHDGTTGSLDVFAPNRLAPDPSGGSVQRPTGWLRLTRPGAAAPYRDEPVETEFERLYDLALDAVRAAPWPDREPYMARLVIEIATGGIERALPVLDERLSTREALHEDLYFSLLDLFHRRAGRPQGDRHGRPGQIVPFVEAAEGDSRLVVRVEPFGPPRDDDDPAWDAGDPLAALEAAERSPPLPAVQRCLDRLGGEARDGRSVEGRRVHVRRFDGDPPHVLLTAACHGNETSGIVGALAAARELVQRGIGFTLIPVQNPDGYALHRRLVALAPHHMHHAARYTALGDDLAHRRDEPLCETAPLRAAQAEATLQIDLHGYPAHEWTRPFTGYLPAGFESWSMPRGFFLLIDHRRGLAGRAQAFADRLTVALARDPDLIAFNAARLALRRPHGDDPPLPLVNGIPVRLREAPRLATPLELVTEFPDETLHGPSFRFAHRIQARAALAAVDALLAVDV